MMVKREQSRSLSVDNLFLYDLLAVQLKNFNCKFYKPATVDNLSALLLDLSRAVYLIIRINPTFHSKRCLIF